ncbi:MAG: 4-(cytidine 5'-diphospho)-2-C-methyl-D-erythritol kinase [bacterium]|nr:4-(cytidine 5'-diphospho)-2-C-methyl-D-erythritol kinase [bacterium]
MLLKAYAKVNLGLKIVGERPDGYHNIETIMQTINFFDELEISKNSHGIDFSSNCPPYGKENMCFKAANLFLTRMRIKTGVKINLTKQIWIGAGLGGGSSCAAKTLVGLNNLFGNLLSYDALFKLALELGSDVPFFLKGGIAFIKGRGDIITPLPHLEAPLWFILVYPKFSISTAWAYKEVKNYLTKERCNFKISKNAILNGNIKELSQNLYNDFEQLVFQTYPKLQEIKENILKLGALGASLSGSGSCVYGILQERDIKLNKKFIGLDVKLVNAVNSSGK